MGLMCNCPQPCLVLPRPYFAMPGPQAVSHPACPCRHVPGNLYRSKQGSNLDARTNELVIRIQPKEAIYLKINNKVGKATGQAHVCASTRSHIVCGCGHTPSSQTMAESFESWVNFHPQP